MTEPCGEACSLALSTFPDEETARRIVRILVEERLVACVNLIPGATSIYRWEGEICEEKEVVGLFKTRTASVEALGLRLTELHPFEVPEWIVVSIGAGSPAYLNWVGLGS